MLKRLAKFLLWLSGWKLKADVPAATQRCVIIAAPHTSNWDIWYARLGFYIMDIPLRFTIKKEWMRFPANLLIQPLGGIAIDRKPRKGSTERPSYVSLMAELFSQYKNIAVMVTPEGTRSRREEWKTGFYYVALQAQVPICLGYLDYAKKEAGVGAVIHPSGDLEADMRRIMDFYRPIRGKHPELFSLDRRFVG